MALWHGTLAPLGLGVTTGTFRRAIRRGAADEGAADYRITNMSAASTHYRMMKNSGKAGDFNFAIRKLTYTGEPIDPATLDFIDATFHVPACSMYGTTEIGVVLAIIRAPRIMSSSPARSASLSPASSSRSRTPTARRVLRGWIGELMLWRRDQWETTKDRARIDEEGYFYHCGRADDVIISAGWTMSAVEIENTLLKHADVKEAAVIGVPDETRGQVVKAFVVTDRAASADFVTELQNFTREKLSQHEFPRHIEFADELPKTPAGKVHRKVLREREAAKAAALAN